MGRIHRLVALTGVAAVAGACAGGPDSTVTTVDSLGVQIVTNVSSEVPPGRQWSVSSEPFLELGGGVEPDTPLLRVTALTLTGGGRVAVGMNAPPQVLVFDETGSVVGILGGEGSGPGEYASVFSVVALPGDSIGVWDAYRRRILLFSRTGEPGRVIDLSSVIPIPVGAAANEGMESGLTRLLASDSGHLILFSEGAVAGVPERTVTRPTMPAHWISLDGSVLATSPPIPGMEVLLGDPIGPIPVPFGARTYAVAVGPELMVGTAEAPEFKVFGSDGELARIIRWPDGPRDLSGPFMEKWSGLAREWAEEAGPLGAVLETVPKAHRLPAYMDMFASDQGEVFVGRYPGPLGAWPMRRDDDSPDILRPTLRVPERDWMVFDTGGVLLATVQTPEGFEPYLARDSTLWGVYTDDLQIESVRAYRLTRR